MTLRDHFNNQVASKPMEAASNREIKALHDLKAWLHYGWAQKELQRLRRQRNNNNRRHV